MCQERQICYRGGKIILGVSTVPTDPISRSLVVAVETSAREIMGRDMAILVQAVVVEKIGKEASPFSRT